MTSLQTYRQLCRLLLVLFSLITCVAQADSKEQYTLDNTWERARERLQLLEESNNPHTFEQLSKIDIKKGWVCMDAGAGYGGVTRWLAGKVGKKGRVDALDMETGFLREINLRNVKVVEANLVDDSLPVDTYDLIVARYVLMHIPQREEAIKKLVGALKPGGTLLVEDLGMYPNRFVRFSDDQEVNTMADQLHYDLEQAGHMSFLSAYDNPAYLEAAGLTDVKSSGYSPYHYGGNAEGKMLNMSLIQLKNLMVNKMGLDGVLYEKVSQQYLNNKARWWGLTKVVTTGVKSK